MRRRQEIEVAREWDNRIGNMHEELFVVSESQLQVKNAYIRVFIRNHLLLCKLIDNVDNDV